MESFYPIRTLSIEQKKTTLKINNHKLKQNLAAAVSILHETHVQKSCLQWNNFVSYCRFENCKHVYRVSRQPVHQALAVSLLQTVPLTPALENWAQAAAVMTFPLPRWALIHCYSASHYLEEAGLAVHSCCTGMQLTIIQSVRGIFKGPKWACRLELQGRDKMLRILSSLSHNTHASLY